MMREMVDTNIIQFGFPSGRDTSNAVFAIIIVQLKRKLLGKKNNRFVCCPGKDL